IPGGFGPTDAAMILTLTGGGVATVSATAAVLLYRLISFALIVAVGWIVWAASAYADRRARGRLPIARAEVVETPAVVEA
ncbi:MAG: hypothetical protein J0H43_12650, partial [Actinobacteria bacterium]|nr:hypothetical protein [Actinomycetota bacterium]